MTNIEKYNQIFIQVFEADAANLSTLRYKGTELWDSVGQLSLISALENAYGITMDADDIRGLDSYQKGIEILKTKYEIQL